MATTMVTTVARMKARMNKLRFIDSKNHCLVTVVPSKQRLRDQNVCPVNKPIVAFVIEQ